MTQRSVEHGSFTVERVYAAPPERVFSAWALQTAKDLWFGAGDDFLATTHRYDLDFRVGGREQLDGTMPSGRAFSYEAIYHDIVDAQRIVLSYVVTIDAQRTSVSLMTVELINVPDGTRLILTEQGAFLDGLDSNAQREEGALDSLDKLGQYLDAQVASAR